MDRTAERKPSARDVDDELDDDALFEALENEDDSGYRANRIEQLNSEFASAQNNSSALSSTGAVPPATLREDGLYPTLQSDQALLDFTTQTHRCVIHFAHPDFARCNTMDEHICALAARHHEVPFARVDVRNTPFVVEKIKIKVLPCVIGFKDGVAVERVIGFEGLGSGGRDGKDSFSTATLEKRLLYTGILNQTKLKPGDKDSLTSDDDSDEDEPASRKTIRTGNARYRSGHDDEEDEDDWD
ncbi:thioredoxin domain-containing protein [Aspergillus affinis]|uniref:thioredoxin domain-containing protein n=1 Tax=Aspergillus affinis TaxID=1070780 RepID=UPI0022FDE013|nr:thioredoxin-like protein [Aspergillus affinis]KAI9037366.1 thioredoxin-like protein [Aspergillus affinis]